MVDVQIIAIETAEGGVAVMQFILDDGRSVQRKATRKAIDAELEAAGYGGCKWRKVQPDDIPADRTFRDAWAPDFSIDLGKARDVHRSRLREQRAPRLAELDVAFMRAVESGDKAAQASIAKQKQALRDVTTDPRIEAATRPDDLLAVQLPLA